MHLARQSEGEVIRRRDLEGVEPHGHPGAEGENREPQETDGCRIRAQDRRGASDDSSEHADAEHLHEGCESNCGREGETRAREGENKAADEIGEAEALEDGLKDEPLADEAGHRRHGGKAHGCEEGAAAARHASQSVCGQKQ